jgi:hypothetical protein
MPTSEAKRKPTYYLVISKPALKLQGPYQKQEVDDLVRAFKLQNRTCKTLVLKRTTKGVNQIDV